MLTPRGFAEAFPDIYRREIAAGRRDKRLRLSVFDARSLCYGIVWLTEGTYPWITDSERTAIHAMAERLKDAPRPADLERTPEEHARELLARFETMPVEASADLTLGEALDLCTALEQLATATYPYPLTAQAQAKHAASPAAA
jgi:hypothetical protein